MIVVPPPPPPSGNLGPAPVSAILPLTDAPSLLRSVPLGAILQGTVAANTPGALIVQTAQGQINLAVTLAGLKVGQSVTLTLQPGSGGGQVLIQADRPPTPGATTVADLLPSIQGGAQPARPGAIVQATVIRAGDPPAPTPPAAGAAPPALPSPAAPSQAAPVAASPSPSIATPAPTGALPLASQAGGAITAQTAAPAASPSPAAAQPSQTAAVAVNQPPAPAGSAPSPPAPTGTPAATQPLTGQTAPLQNPGAPQQNTAAPPPIAPQAQPPGSASPAIVPTPAPTQAASAGPTPSKAPATLSSGAAAQTSSPPQPVSALRAEAGTTPGFLLGANSGDRVPVRVVALLPGGPPPGATQTLATPATPPFAPTTPATTAGARTSGPTTGSAIPTTLAPGNFIGVVVGASANGSAIVQAGAGLITLEGVAAPPNSALILAPAALRGQAATTPAPVANAALATALPGVNDLINAANATGGSAQAAMQAILPRLGPQMAAGMVFFMRAIRTGDLNEWLGKDARTAIERSGRASSVKKAAADLEQAARTNETSGEWSSYPIPMGVGGQRVEPIRLYVRQSDEDGDSGGSKGGKGKPTRFLIDVTLSRLGRIQLDGLARLPKLDLVLRSEAPLDPGVQQPLRRFFADVTSARGIQGEMSFQVAPPIDPTAATPARARPGIVV